MKERGNPRKQEASPRHQAKDESNLTDAEPGPDARTGRRKSSVTRQEVGPKFIGG